VGAVDHPGNVGLRKTLPQGSQHRQTVDDVAEGAGLDEGDTGRVVIAQRCSSVNGWHGTLPFARCELILGEFAAARATSAAATRPQTGTATGATRSACTGSAPGAAPGCAPGRRRTG